MKTHVVCGIFTVFILFAACLFPAFTAYTGEPPSMPANGSLLPQGAEGDWVLMPSGARSAYIGIHGGTMPVSLLAARDGQTMAAFVGQTGNDFLCMLRRPSSTRNHGSLIQAYPDDLADFPQDDSPSGQFVLQKPGSNATILMAATHIGTLPVIYASGQSFSRLDLSLQDWLPFGLSEKALSLEGQVGKPLIISAKPHKNNKTARWRFGSSSLY